jgi:hypothetical protein
MLEQGAQQGWNRRQFLRSAGVAIGLPFFPSLFPRTAWAEAVTPPTRLMFMAVPLGFVPNRGILGNEGTGVKDPKYYNAWFPEEDGAKYKMPAVHAGLEPYREHISFLKGLSNQKYRGETHYGDDVFLTCADTFADPSRSFSNTVSCDQVAAKYDVMGGANTRYSSLALGIAPVFGAHSGGLSWTEQGLPVSPLQSPAQVFDLLFGKDDVPAATRLLRLKQKKSVLDMMVGQIRDLDRKLNAADRRKLNEVISAVRGVETNIQREEKWLNVPKPKVALPRPEELQHFATTQHSKAMFDLAHAAFLTDSTRVITYGMPDTFRDITPFDKHGLNHPSENSKASEDAVRLDRAMSDQIARFVKLLSETKEHDGRPLIYHTIGAFGAGVWGRNHSLKSLPLMLIGHGSGHIQTGQTRSYPGSTPLANAWLTMLNACRVPVKSFADSTGTLDGVMG